MSKVVAMIPVRSGSKRIPKKNIRLLDGKPLVAYAIEAAKNSGSFDEIYLNSEDEIFRDIANEYGIKFYKRARIFATDEATNDDFLFDFLCNVECDYAVQVLCTSPFLKYSTVAEFTKQLVDDELDTLISVKNVQIECLYDGKPINFNKSDRTQPSQMLIPVKSYACSIMGYASEQFKDNYRENEGAYHGSKGFTDYYVLSGFETVDIDNEEDFQLAEAICRMLSSENVEPKYYKKKQVKAAVIERDVPSILKKDGVIHNNLFDSNKLIVNIQDIIDANSKTESWSHRFVDTQSNSCTLISQLKSQGNRIHFHENWDEWWHIVQGSWKFTIEGEDHIVKSGDVVLIERGKRHRIEALEDNSIRLAVSRSDVAHIYQ